MNGTNIELLITQMEEITRRIDDTSIQIEETKAQISRNNNLGTYSEQINNIVPNIDLGNMLLIQERLVQSRANIKVDATRRTLEQAQLDMRQYRDEEKNIAMVEYDKVNTEMEMLNIEEVRLDTERQRISSETQRVKALMDQGTVTPEERSQLQTQFYSLMNQYSQTLSRLADTKERQGAIRGNLSAQEKKLESMGILESTKQTISERAALLANIGYSSEEALVKVASFIEEKENVKRLVEEQQRNRQPRQNRSQEPIQPPVQEYDEPQEPVQPQFQGYGVPQQPVQPPVQGYGVPQQTVQPPVQGYGVPQEPVQPPVQVYGAPQQTVQPPVQGYGVPQQPIQPPVQVYNTPQVQMSTPLVEQQVIQPLRLEDLTPEQEYYIKQSIEEIAYGMMTYESKKYVYTERQVEDPKTLELKVKKEIRIYNYEDIYKEALLNHILLTGNPEIAVDEVDQLVLDYREGLDTSLVKEARRAMVKGAQEAREVPELSYKMTVRPDVDTETYEFKKQEYDRIHNNGSGRDEKKGLLYRLKRAVTCANPNISGALMTQFEQKEDFDAYKRSLRPYYNAPFRHEVTRLPEIDTYLYHEVVDGRSSRYDFAQDNPEINQESRNYRNRVYPSQEYGRSSAPAQPAQTDRRPILEEPYYRTPRSPENRQVIANGLIGSLGNMYDENFGEPACEQPTRRERREATKLKHERAKMRDMLDEMEM